MVEKTKKIKNKKNITKENKPCPECEEYKNKWVRACADYENFRKEMEVNRSRIVKLSEIELIDKFLPVYDNFSKAFADKTIEGEDEKRWVNWKQGIEYIMKQFESVLTDLGVQKIETIGHEFDPEIHEAVKEQDSDKYDSGQIISELEAGYIKDEIIVRPAKVIVSK